MNNTKSSRNNRYSSKRAYINMISSILLARNSSVLATRRIGFAFQSSISYSSRNGSRSRIINHQTLWYGNGDDNDTPSTSSLPYSTTSSNSIQASQVVDSSLSSKSSLPFSAPRTSFDDSLPAAQTSDSIVDGTLEWSKLGLLTDLVSAVTGDIDQRQGLGLIEGPTPVQKMAIPDILAGCKDRMASIENIKNTDKKSRGSESSYSSLMLI